MMSKKCKRYRRQVGARQKTTFYTFLLPFSQGFLGLLTALVFRIGFEVQSIVKTKEAKDR